MCLPPTRGGIQENGFNSQELRKVEALTLWKAELLACSVLGFPVRDESPNHCQQSKLEQHHFTFVTLALHTEGPRWISHCRRFVKQRNTERLMAQVLQKGHQQTCMIATPEEDTLGFYRTVNYPDPEKDDLEQKNSLLRIYLKTQEPDEARSPRECRIE